MNKIRLISAALVLTFVLFVSQPMIINAQNAEPYVNTPAVVFVQDKDDKMLVKHNFESDPDIYIPMGKETDSGFYVTIPSGN